MKSTRLVLLINFTFVTTLSWAQFNTLGPMKDSIRPVSILETVDKIDSLKVDSLILETKKVEYNLGVLPLDDIYVTSFYGDRFHPIKKRYIKHNGVDLRAKDKGVYAVQKGIITEVGYDQALGQFIRLQCGTFEFVYGHLAHSYITLGSLVNIGDIIGRTGGTGDVTAKHLHFAMKKDGKFIDPYPILSLIYKSSTSDFDVVGQ